jgi:hypothetical protein
MCRRPFVQARLVMKMGCDSVRSRRSPTALGLCALFLLSENTGTDRAVPRRAGLLSLARWNGHGLLREEGLWAFEIPLQTDSKLLLLGRVYGAAFLSIGLVAGLVPPGSFGPRVRSGPLDVVAALFAPA